MVKQDDFKYGWDYMAKLLGSDVAANLADSDYAANLLQNQAIHIKNEQIQEINKTIDLFAKSINEHTHLGLNEEQLKGYVAEEWHSWTFNIDALQKGSEHRATVLHENTYGSIDVDTNFNKAYSLKYSNTTDRAENLQAALDPDTRLPKYANQERLIAAEQVEDAKHWAERRAAKDSVNRPEVSESHIDTKEHLTGKISDGEGVESRELSIKEAKQIAQEAKGEGFEPEKHGYHKDALLDEARIDYINGALKAGLTAATITAIMQIVPELYKAIDYLIKHGEIDLKQLNQSGVKVISTSGEAFLRGSIAYGVQSAIEQGLLGETLKGANPTVVGTVVAIVLGTVKDSILVAAGKITPREMGAKFFDSVVVSSGYLVGGLIGQALFPEIPCVAYAIGSLLGCSVAVVYNIGKKKLISFCIDTGFTCFGLVEQNYELPEQVLHDMGVHTIPIPKTGVSTVKVEKTDTAAYYNATQYETVDIKVLKRGLIGVNKIGYVI